MRHKKYNCNIGCPIEASLEAIGGKWKGIILFHLQEEKIRFNALHRLIPDITQRMLTKQLRQLEEDQIVFRKIYPEVPPKVEYYLTDFGKTLTPIISALKIWGTEYIDKLVSIRTDDVSNG